MAIRKKFNWVDPVTKKKHKELVTTPQFIKLLTRTIQTEEQAEDFLEAYRAVSEHAEHNVGYFANLIQDKDVRDDVLELFMVDLQTEPRQVLNKEYRLSQIFQRR